ncbi:MAG: hypothetical protein NXY57DRAFT_298613 [Lentinula lateritia]|nr:MAG: hypothetical protein NXY57DRAFT_298613 [Lentinula lateritia]
MQSSINDVTSLWFVGGITGAVSAVSLILRSMLRYSANRGKQDEPSSGAYAPITQSPVFLYRFLRVLACLAFAALTFASFTRSSKTLTKTEIVITSLSIVRYCVPLNCSSA